MSDYSEFFLNTAPTIAQLDLLEISHPSFFVTHRLVRNAVNGVTVMHEGGAGPFAYSYMPMRVKALASNTDMDQELEITLGDTGDTVPSEIQAITNANAFHVKPTLVYRTYRSDDLTAPLFGPIFLRVEGVAMQREGTAFRAKSATFNRVRTGETYNLIRFPMLAPLA